MTEEELLATIEEVDRGIEELSDPEKLLSPADKKRRGLLVIKKDCLEEIKQAKARNDSKLELRHSTNYSLLCNFGNKNPFLLHFIQNKLRNRIF